MSKFVPRLLSIAIASFILGARTIAAADLPMDDSNPLRMPSVGDHQLRLITPTLLELELITTKNPDPAPATVW
ncbi:MAG: hypothetical protein JWR19_2432, partial [Pedosphaera sp.]|nr:hypothetical protein [Pedosphaera sp.]